MYDFDARSVAGALKALERDDDPAGSMLPFPAMGDASSTAGGRVWVAAALAVFVLFLVHAALFGDWIVDDAGISLAYARNLSSGHGLVAQPGAEPVEGFSNALWTLLLAVSDRVGLLDPVLTPKILSSVLILGAFLLLARSLVHGHDRSAAPVAVALAASAASTPFVVWSISGLENALYVFLLSALASVCLRVARRGDVTQAESILTGGLCFLLVSTRPDGLLYVPLPAFLFALSGERSTARRAILHASAFAVPWGIATMARIRYFGDVLPNTFYAKRGMGWEVVNGWVETLGPPRGGLVFIAAVCGLVFVTSALGAVIGRRVSRGSSCPPWAVFAGYVAIGYLALETLPTDWMPEVRFGTPLFLFGPLLVVEAGSALAELSHRDKRTMAGWLAPALLLVLVVSYSSRHTAAFRHAPTVPLSDIRGLAVELDRLADRAGLERASVLLPDIGGSLWENRFDVVDLAGLTDRGIALEVGRDRHALLSFVVERSPDLIWVHGYWREWADFESDAAFTARYRPVPPRLARKLPAGQLYARVETLRRLRRHRTSADSLSTRRR